MIVKLGTLATFKGGSAFPRDQQGHDSGVIPFMKVSDLSLEAGAWRIGSAAHWLQESQLPILKPVIIPARSTVFAKIGEGLKNERCRFTTRPTAIDNNMMAAMPKENVYPHYLHYLIKSIGLSTYAVGSALPYLKQSTLTDIAVNIPSRGEQQAIAEVLGALDDKIAANTKMASTADQWIRAEYDLIKRQSSEDRIIGDLVSHRRQAVDPVSLETPVPYVGLEHIPRRLMWLNNHGSSEEVTSNKSYFHTGDILFGKLRPYFHKVVTTPTSGICSTDVLVLVSKEEIFSGYVLASLTHDDVIQAVTALSAGTRMPRTNWRDLSQVIIPWPGDLIATAFSESVQTIREYVVGLMAENQTLAATRDVLLPQLMSGEIRVKDAEKISEDSL